MLYVVSYTLEPARVNMSLITELQGSPDWAHYLDSTWLIATNETAEDLSARIRTHLNAADLLLVVEIKQGSTKQGWLPKDAWDWINNRGMIRASY